MGRRTMNAPSVPVPPPDELSRALTELGGLMLVLPSVERAIDDVAGLATGVVSPPASCGITLERGSQPLTVASSGALASHVDEVQYAQDDGPCLEAMRTGHAVMVDDMASELRWDGYPAHALAYGVRSSLSLPLGVDAHTRGALNLYATHGAAFSQEAQQRAELFARQASAVLAVVTRQSRQLVLSDQLRAALANRSVIDQAIGIVMDQQRCDAAHVFTVLRQASQHRNLKLRDIAVELVTTVSGSAPAPPTFSEPS
jgi:GAF domain-containing protein